jgi:curved DNA-binding protein CbpA
MHPAAAAFDPYAVLQVAPTADPEVVQAAFRALAFKYHPDRDQTTRAARKMADLNRARAMLRDERARLAYDRSRRAATAPAPGPTPMRPGPGVAPGSPDGSVLDFGRYRGWSLRDLARHDPDYLLWLSRHSSGIRYRTEIYAILRTIGVSAA